ncbi:Uncharacterised protein [Vibrio cholerae]|nr:Uncharacterised protein [Vibrio cholerae]CSC83104.1 Uncharacterised protein [Vibrio cholerae]
MGNSGLKLYPYSCAFCAISAAMILPFPLSNRS